MTRKKFTLIELLIVITIISILASLLLPALNRARTVAKSSVCQGNLKQISSMFFCYVSDYDEYFPHSPNFAGTPIFAPLLLGIKPDESLTTAAATAIYQPFTCPGFKTNTNIGGFNKGYQEGAPWRFSYMYNRDWLANSNPALAKRYRLTQIRKPSDKSLQIDFPCFEVNTGIAQFSSATATWTNWIPGEGSALTESRSTIAATCPYLLGNDDYMKGRHAITVNVLFIDGHVQNIPSRTAATDLHYTLFSDPTRSMFRPMDN